MRAISDPESSVTLSAPDRVGQGWALAIPRHHRSGRDPDSDALANVLDCIGISETADR